MSVANWLLRAFLGLGGPGLLLLAALDSSFFIIPVAQDLLIIVLVARDNILLPYYAAMATVGSLIGAFIIDALFRRGGRTLMERTISRERLDYLQRKAEWGTGWVLAVAAVLPPPFPMKPAVAAAAALQYPRKRMFVILGVTRMLRFSTIGLIGIFFEQRVIAFMESPILGITMYILIALGLVLSAISIYKWVKQSRTEAPAA